jgi:hypothetical protein
MAESSSLGLKVSVKRVNGDRSTQEYEYTSNLDGKSYPITGQGPYGADSTASNLTAPNTIQSTLNEDSKLVATGSSVVSKNGNVLTITTKGVDASGKPFSYVRVRQTVALRVDVRWQGYEVFMNPSYPGTGNRPKRCR